MSKYCETKEERERKGKNNKKKKKRKKKKRRYTLKKNVILTKVFSNINHQIEIRMNIIAITNVEMKVLKKIILSNHTSHVQRR